LINSSRELDPDVPSPGQFDHVITAVPKGNGLIWLDSTAEVAQFGHIFSVLSAKQALVVYPTNPAALVSTPDLQPQGVETFTAKGKIDEAGTLNARMERTSSADDIEVLLRSAFRRTPLPQWKDLVDRISHASGFAGDVSNVDVSPPERIDQPFTI